MLKSEFLNILNERGYIHQCTNLEALDQLFLKEQVVAYIGFDCTGKSLHVGHLLQLMRLRILQKCGHKPIALMGGGTSKVGDPTGKDEMRQFLSIEDIASNKESIKNIFSNFMNFGDNHSDAIMPDNDDWLAKVNYLDFLRDYGKHFSINRMLTFDSVKARLDRNQPLTFLEFNYSLLQAYDFVELFKRYNCRLQFGGSDQWGNIVSGTDLGRRLGCPELFGLTSPLLVTSSGIKMGKTAKGAVWLRDDMLSAYDYWQFWRNTEDADVIRFLKLVTEVPLDEIEKLSHLSGAELNEAKILLANEVTSLCHGKEAAITAHRTAMNIFSNASADDIPFITMSENDLGIPLFKLLHNLKFVDSSGEAKRLIQGGGVRINDEVVNEYQLVERNLFENGKMKVSLGKKKHYFVRTNAI